jgi:hypothetical protein
LSGLTDAGCARVRAAAFFWQRDKRIAADAAPVQTIAKEQKA